MIATTKAGGQYMAPADPCLTPAPPAPPIPIPYPNMAMPANASDTTTTVLIENKEALVEGSKIPNSNGDEAGVNGGVMSGVNMKECQPKMFSSKVFLQGKKVTFATAPSGHNGTSSNTVGMNAAPSQMKVLVSA